MKMRLVSFSFLNLFELHRTAALFENYVAQILPDAPLDLVCELAWRYFCFCKNFDSDCLVSVVSKLVAPFMQLYILVRENNKQKVRVTKNRCKSWDSIFCSTQQSP